MMDVKKLKWTRSKIAILVVLMAGTLVALGGCSTTGQSAEERPAQDTASEESSAPPEEQQEDEQAVVDTADEAVVFEYGDETYEHTWHDVPGGTFEIALPDDVDNLDLDVTDEGTISIWGRERDILAAHADNPDEVPMRGRIFITSRTIEDDQERSIYQEEFAQSLSDSIKYEHRAGGTQSFGGVEGSFQDRSWHFSGTDRSRSFKMVDWTTLRFEVVRGPTVWNFVLLAPESEAEKFEALFTQALETLREKE